MKKLEEKVDAILEARKSRAAKEDIVERILSQGKFKSQFKSLAKTINAELKKQVEDPDEILWMEISDAVVGAVAAGMEK